MYNCQSAHVTNLIKCRYILNERSNCEMEESVEAEYIKSNITEDFSFEFLILSVLVPDNKRDTTESCNVPTLVI